MPVLRGLVTRLFGSASGPTALATVYLRQGRYFIEASDRTRQKEAGFWVSSGQVRVLDESASDSDLGDAVLASLSTSRLEVDVPARGTNLEEGLFRAMGVRSRRAAMTGTRACQVTSQPNGEIRVEPQMNGGASGESRGYRPMPDAGERLPPPSTSPAIGQSIRVAMNRATVAR